MNMRLLMSAAVTLMLAACVTVPEDRGVSQSVALLKTRSSNAAVVKFNRTQDMTELLSQPLDADAAVRVALNRNARMQVLYAQLGMAQAEVYDASRLSNPTLGFMRLSGDSGAQTTWTLTQSFTELLFINYRARLGRAQILQAQQQLAQSVLELEAQVRSAYYQYVSARLIAQLYEQSSFAAQVASDYAQSLFNAGNISELQLSREQAAASRAHIELQGALNNAQQLQASLLTLMGLSMQAAPAFVERLEVPVAQALEAASLRDWARQQRVDLAMLREQESLYGAMQRHTRRWFWLSDTSLQLEREHETDGTILRGAGGSVGLPIFNQGKGSRLRAQAQVETAHAELTTLQLTIDNDVTAQVDFLQRARLMVEEYRQRLVPMQERVLELSQQQQNYMLIGAFELLNARREVLQSYQDYLTAAGDYWLQYVALCKTVGGRLPDTAAEANAGSTVGVDALPEASMTDKPAATPADETHHEPPQHAEHSHIHHGEAP
jgi:cobalt-zinc-cadmium efflux system outer membrane protein